MTENLRLTDDEVAALAAERSVAWPSELPSVDVEDVTAVMAAVTRGRRSLYARRLVDLVPVDDEQARVSVEPGLEEMADLVAGARRWIRLYLAGDSLTRASYELLSYYYRRPDGDWLRESVDEGGVRTLSRASDDEVGDLFLSLVGIVRERGVPGAPADGPVTTLCIAAGGSERASVLAVTHGRARLLTIGSDHEVHEQDVAEPELAAALGILRAEVTRIRS